MSGRDRARVSDTSPADERPPQDDAEPSSDDAPIRVFRPEVRRRLRRGAVGVLFTLGLLRVLAPGLIDVVATAKLERVTGGACSIDDVDVDLLGATITFEGVAITAEDGERSASALRIAEVNATWGWHAHLFGDGGVALDVHGLELDVDLNAPWPATIAGGTTREEPNEPMIRSIDLAGGRIVALVDGAPILTLGALNGELDATAFGAGTDDSQTTRLSLRAEDLRGGTLELDAAFAPIAPRRDFSLDLVAERVDLRQLNPVFRRVLELDVEEGALSASVRLNQVDGRRRGRIEHEFHGLRLYSPTEPEVAHPMAEALFEAMLKTSDQPILIDEAVDPEAAGDLDLRAGLDETAYKGALDRITGVILRGYERRLNTLDGYRATIGALEVDFPRNHLSFEDIRIDKRGAEVNAPFLELRRLEVDVEQSVLIDAIETHKAVTLVEPHLTFIAGPDEEHTQLSFDPEWTEKISALPFPTDSLTIEGGTIALRETASADTPAELGLVDLEVDATCLAPGGAPAQITLAAQIVGGGALTAELSLAPQAEPVEGALSLHLGATPLTALNPLTRHLAGVDAAGGTIALDVDATIGGGEARATILPDLRDVELLGADEEHDRPLRELLLGVRLRRLAGEPLELRAPASTIDQLRAALPSALLEAAMAAS